MSPRTRRSPTVFRPTNRSIINCVSAFGGGLPCPEVGVYCVTTNRLAIRRVPIPGNCPPSLGYVGFGILNVNQSFTNFTGSVPVPGCCLPGPGYVVLVILNVSWSFPGFTNGDPAPGSGLRGPGVCCINNSYLGRFGLAPLRGLSRRCCPGSRMTTSRLTAPAGISRPIYLLVSGPVLCQPHEADKIPPQFPWFHR